VICWSGTVAVFSHELDWLADERLRAPTANQMAWQEIEEQVEAAKPGWHILAINAPLHPGFAAEVWIADRDEIWHRVWADPASGEVLGTTSYFNVQRFFRSFHMSLFIGGWRIWGIPFGYWLVGLAAFVLAASLITSLIFYRRFWRGFFKLEWRRGRKIFWSDLHKLTGLWSLWFIALIAATGMWYLVEWKVTSEAPVPDPPAAEGSVQQTLPVAALVARAEQAYPALEIRTVVLDQMSSGLFEVHGQDGAWLVRDRGARVWLDARNGSTIAIRRAAQMRPLHRWIDTADPLHFGNFAGIWSKILWFLFGIGLSGICLTGVYLQAKRQQRHSTATRRGPIVAAYAATASVLLASVPFAYGEMLRWGVGGELPGMPLVVVAVISLWLFLTLTALTLWVRAVR
ncbi:MAG TPA: PepSY-associated TM helix domain-containing protein, partial [Sphingobium sp.]|nr:PepSY-associated TM helix domain-containing protein [Sphingobium sp.]